MNQLFVSTACFLIFAAVTVAQKPECTVPKDSGNGKDAIQKFYYNDKWHTCFGFKYTGKGGNKNNFDSYSACMGNCAMLDGSMCTGPLPSKSPINEMAFDCGVAKCPDGYKCGFGTHVECCNIKQAESVDAAFSEKCPDGSKAGGASPKGYFEATFGESCKDLVCGKGQKCVQVNKDFAKCCGGK